MQLLGVYEIAELFGLSRPGASLRTREPDFPEPVARLRCGPVWTRDQVVEYARRRSIEFVERPGVVALARSPVTPSDGRVKLASSVLGAEEAARLAGDVGSELVSPREAARMIGAPVDEVLDLGYGCPGGIIVGGKLEWVRRDAIGALARTVGRRYAAPVEERA